MLIFISDLHFVDGTAGEHNFPCRAFEYFMEDICDLIAKPSNDIQEIKLIFLGDTFDLLRSERWFAVPEEERPWGSNRLALEAHARDVFEAIVNHEQNFNTFRLLGSDLQQEFGLPLPVEKIFISGNHDRLCNDLPSLRRRVCQCLGLSHDPEAYFPHFFHAPPYRVLARHGHEYDSLNFAGQPHPGQVLPETEYVGVPIGDPITTELITRLPYALDRRLAQLGYDEEIRTTIRRNFQEIDNVRPLYAVIDWLLYQVKTDQGLEKLRGGSERVSKKDLEAIIEDTLDRVVSDFQKLSFVRSWLRQASWPTSLIFRLALGLLGPLRIFKAKKLVSLLIKYFAFSKDTLLTASVSEFDGNPEYSYIVYGHTHEPLVVPLEVRQQPAPWEEIYLNTGTWRARENKAAHGKSFVKWKNLTYLIFYLPEERLEPLPLFETWTGTLKSEAGKPEKALVKGSPHCPS